MVRLIFAVLLAAFLAPFSLEGQTQPTFLLYQHAWVQDEENGGGLGIQFVDGEGPVQLVRALHFDTDSNHVSGKFGVRYTAGPAYLQAKAGIGLATVEGHHPWHFLLFPQVGVQLGPTPFSVVAMGRITFGGDGLESLDRRVNPAVKIGLSMAGGGGG